MYILLKGQAEVNEIEKTGLNIQDEIDKTGILAFWPYYQKGKFFIHLYSSFCNTTKE